MRDGFTKFELIASQFSPQHLSNIRLIGKEVTFTIDLETKFNFPPRIEGKDRVRKVQNYIISHGSA